MKTELEDRDKKIAHLEKENERLVRAWHNLHSQMVKDRADHEDYFVKSQARMLELQRASQLHS